MIEGFNTWLIAEREYVDWVVIGPMWIDVYDFKPTYTDNFKVRVLHGILCDN